MKVTLTDGKFVAEGDYADCAAWTLALIMVERDMAEKRRKEKEAQESKALQELLNTEFIELIRREKNKEDESHE